MNNSRPGGGGGAVSTVSFIQARGLSSRAELEGLNQRCLNRGRVALFLAVEAPSLDDSSATITWHV